MEGGVGAEQELSADNLRGIVLALLSSGFIGGSFIIKKKGLPRRRRLRHRRRSVGRLVASSDAERHSLFLFSSEFTNPEMLRVQGLVGTPTSWSPYGGLA